MAQWLSDTMFFFWASTENYQVTSPAHCGAEDSVGLLLTKNSACSFSCPWCLICTDPAALADSWPGFGPLTCADSSLAF